MIQIKRKSHDKYIEVAIVASTITYADLAKHVGHNPEQDSSLFTVSTDGGRKMPVQASDEMTVIDDLQIEIDW